MNQATETKTGGTMRSTLNNTYPVGSPKWNEANLGTLSAPKITKEQQESYKKVTAAFGDLYKAIAKVLPGFNLGAISGHLGDAAEVVKREIVFAGGGTKGYSNA